MKKGSEKERERERERERDREREGRREGRKGGRVREENINILPASPENRQINNSKWIMPSVV